MELYELIAATGKVQVTLDSRATNNLSAIYEPVQVYYSEDPVSLTTLASGGEISVYISQSGHVLVLTEGTSGVVLVRGTADRQTELQTVALEIVQAALTTIAGEPSPKRTRKTTKPPVVTEPETTVEPIVETVPTEPVQEEQILNEPDAPTTDEG